VIEHIGLWIAFDARIRPLRSSRLALNAEDLSRAQEGGAAHLPYSVTDSNRLNATLRRRFEASDKVAVYGQSFLRPFQFPRPLELHPDWAIGI